MLQLTLEYLLFVCVATCGVVQVVASHSNLKSLLFFKNRILTYIFAIIATGGSFGLFFGWDSRMDEQIMHTGLEGSQQFGYFLLGAFAGIFVTLLISSLMHRKGVANSEEDSGEGLDRLKNSSYFSAIKDSIRKGKQE